jgi:hypothetical protein
MKKFGQYMREDLTGALVEPQSDSSAQAKKLGLTYVGFGRYTDNTGQVSYIVQDDKLIPFSKAVKSNSFKQLSGDDFGSYTGAMKPQIDQANQDLTSFYPPENYDDAELDAIKTYTEGSYYDINEKLASLPRGIAANKIQPEFDGDTRPQMIASLDSALAKSKTPIDILTYAGLNSDFDPTSLVAGSTFAFKGFRSTSLNPSNIFNGDTVMVMQIRAKAGSKGMYLDDFSATPGDQEFLLPRGSKIKILSGPSKMVGSNAATQDSNKQILYFDCQLVK